MDQNGFKIGTLIAIQNDITATIQPAAMFDLTQDVPDLRGGPVKPDLVGNDFLGASLQAGVNARWDMSRRVAVRAGVSDKNGNPRQVQLAPVDTTTDYPIDPIVGNDDGATGDETNDPYAQATRGKLLGNDLVTRNGAGPLGCLSTGYVDDFYTSQVWFQDFARLQLGPDGSAKWYVISDPLPWRVEFHFRKLPVTERMWNFDANGDRETTDRVITEKDRNVNTDLNGDGNITDTAVALWDDDPAKLTFTQPDNAHMPAPGQ